MGIFDWLFRGAVEVERVSEPVVNYHPLPVGAPLVDEMAVRQLEALVNVPGSLKIITAEVRPELREDAGNPRSLAREGVDLRNPATFVIHDVVRLEGPDDKGRYTACSAEGDWTVGLSSALLKRLQEWHG